jgi:hypothetical protein
MSSALLLTYHGEDNLPGPHGLRTLAGHHNECPLVVPNYHERTKYCSLVILAHIPHDRQLHYMQLWTLLLGK